MSLRLPVFLKKALIQRLLAFRLYEGIFIHQHSRNINRPTFHGRLFTGSHKQ